HCDHWLTFLTLIHHTAPLPGAFPVESQPGVIVRYAKPNAPGRNLVTGPDAKAACRGFGWRREGGLRAAGPAQGPSGAQRIPWPRPGGFLYPGFGQPGSYIHGRRPQANRANPPPGTGPAVRSGPSDGLIGRVLNWEDAWARARINVPKLICDVPVITVSCC